MNELQDIINYINLADPSNEVDAKEAISQLESIAEAISPKLQEIGLKFELEASFGGSWLHGIGDDEDEFDEDGYDYYGYLERGQWVSSSDFPC